MGDCGFAKHDKIAWWQHNTAHPVAGPFLSLVLPNGQISLGRFSFRGFVAQVIFCLSVCCRGEFFKIIREISEQPRTRNPSRFETRILGNFYGAPICFKIWFQFLFFHFSSHNQATSACADTNAARKNIGSSQKIASPQLQDGHQLFRQEEKKNSYWKFQHSKFLGPWWKCVCAFFSLLVVKQL